MRRVWIFLFSSMALFAMEPSKAFDRLIQGNHRFQKGKAVSPHQDRMRREALLQSQNPFAIIVACADSRVAPEILFDQGIGDLFVVRVAGNVIGPFEMESITYAAKYLGSSCILVMGHQNCGAVDAVIQQQTADVPYIARVIEPSVLRAKKRRTKNLLETATKRNAQAMSQFVKSSSIISELISEHKIEVRAAYYHFSTGAVEIL